MKEVLQYALEIATELHKGQTRWNKRIPYITHPIEVAKIAVGLYSRYYGGDAEEIDPKKSIILQIIALFHDIPEDVEAYKSQERKLVLKLREMDIFGALEEGDYDTIVDSLCALNKHRHNGYLDFVLTAKNDHFARFVKMADITHNLSDLDRKKGSMLDKYSLALYILQK